MGDVIDELLGDGTEFYPGSRVRRRPVVPVAAPRRKVRSDAWDARPFRKLINGVEHETFTMGALATALERPIVTVRLWTRKGYIPQAPYRLPSQTLDDGSILKGRRLYTRPLIEAAVAAFENRGLIGSARVEWRDHKDLSIEIFEKWTLLHAAENP